MREVTAEGKTNIEYYKDLIAETRDLYASMTDEEVNVCEEWLDEEFRKETEPRKEESIINSVVTHT